MENIRVCLYTNASNPLRRDRVMMYERKVRTAGQTQEQGSPGDWREWDAGHKGWWAALGTAETFLMMQQARRQSTQVLKQVRWQVSAEAMTECLVISLDLLHQVLKAQLRAERETRWGTAFEEWEEVWPGHSAEWENKHPKEERWDFWVILSTHLRREIMNLRWDQLVEF